VNMSGTSSPSFGAASTSTLSKEEDISITPNEASDNWDKQSQVSTSVEKSAQTTVGNKVPDAEDDWEKEAVSKTPSEKELKAAPIPAVNFWQARKEAQEAKAKALAAQRPAQVTVKAKPQPANTAEGQKSTDEESRRKQPGKPSAKPERDNGGVKRNKGDAAKPRDEGEPILASVFGLTSTNAYVGRRPQTRPPGSGAQATETTGHSNPPPVGDAESWPTPETAISDERKKATQDRPEKPESKNGMPKPHSTKWVPIPYVPSTKFITPLPPAATRRGGRPAIRGGPEVAEPGASASQPNTPSGKNDTAGSMGPPPVPKKASDQERGRNQESSGASRANSVPTQSRRATSTGSASTEQRAFSGTFGKEPAGLNNRTNASPEQQAPLDTLSKNEPTTASGQRSDSKAHSGPTAPAVSTPRRGSSETSRQPSTAGEAHSHPRYEASSRRSIPANFYTNSDIFGNQDQGSAEKSKEAFRPRDYSKDKPESSREKVASWRDREVSFDREGREFRPERTRGSYRGRGASSTYGVHSTSTHPSTAPLPQQPFGSGKSNSFHSGSRQNSHPYSGLSSQSNQRSNVRSQSIPATALYTTMTNQNPSIGPPLSPIHTDMPVYAYQPPMHAGFMSAVPYNAALDSYALLAMVHGQL
jgi:la-related protein 1